MQLVIVTEENVSRIVQALGDSQDDGIKMSVALFGRLWDKKEKGEYYCIELDTFLKCWCASRDTTSSILKEPINVA